MSIREKILELLQKGGLTAEDLILNTGVGYSSVTARLTELSREGIIKYDSTVRCKSSGLNVRVYTLNEDVTPFQELLKLTVAILEEVPSKKRGKFASQVAELVKFHKK